MREARSIPSFAETARCGWIAAVPLSAALILAGGSFSPLIAQTAPAPQNVAISSDALKQREQELEAARLEQQRAADQQARLKADIAAIGADRSKLNQQLVDV